MIDAMHPEQLARLLFMASAYMRLWRRYLHLAPWLAGYNLIGQHNRWASSGLSAPDANALAAFDRLPRHLRAAHREALAWEATFAQVRAAGTLGDTPLAVARQFLTNLLLDAVLDDAL